MKIPNGYTEQQVIDIITKIGKRYRKYKFSYLTEDDIQQECFILGMDGLERYTEGPLENFLAIHIRNRLLNQRRKSGQDYNGEMSHRYYICNPISINIVADIFKDPNLLENLISKELLEYIDKNLDISLRMDYLKFREGFKINKVRKEKLKKELVDIIEAYYE